MFLKGQILNPTLSIVLSFLVGGFAYAHGTDDHKSAQPMTEAQVAISRANNPQPTELGFSSIKLLLSDIEIESGYGRGWYYETPKTKAEEFVNQGFAMLNLFHYTDSFRSFNTAIGLDPDSTIAYVGRALNAINLDGNNSYYLIETYEYIMKHKAGLSAQEIAWSNIFLAMVTGKDINNKALSIAQAYSDLKKADPNNLEAFATINWITNTYNMADFEKVLKKDPEHTGALHYFLHLAEGRNDHAQALSFGERLAKVATGSAHAQHMYGHVLPHFNRWNEADKQFAIADQIHQAWAKKNSVSPNEDWHYGHNLTLFSVTKMVVAPDEAGAVLMEIQKYNPGAVIDTLDFLISITPDDQKAGLGNYLSQIEGYSSDYKNYVLNSRMYYDLVFGSTDLTSVNDIAQDVSKMSNFKNKQFLTVATALIVANNASDTAKQKQIVDYLVKQLDANFSRGGFDGWQKSVMEVLMYKKVFNTYGLTEALGRLEKEVEQVYMNPID